MRRSVLLAALLLAGCAAQNPAMVDHMAVRHTSGQASAFSSYLSARFAAGDHDLKGAAHYYG
jgi:hypothetical protein